MPKSTRYGQYLSRDEVNQLIAPSRLNKEKVELWLDSHSIQGELINNDWIRVQTTVAKAEELLQITYRKFVHRPTGLNTLRSLIPYTVPESVSSALDLVGGTIRFPRVPHQLESRAGIPTTPESIQQMYNVQIPAENVSNVQAVASFLNQFFSPSDLSKFEQSNGLPDVPIAQIFGQNLENLPGVEASLDVQFLLGNPNCSIETWVISTSGKTPSGNEPFLTFLTDLNTLPSMPNLISMSYQDYEFTVTESYAQRCSEEFMKWSTTGITFITGSGDWGVGCENNCTSFTADFPSSSPYVISTGATTLNTEAQEIGVSFSSGGFSNYFGQLSFQRDAVQQYLAQSGLPPSSYFNSSGRAFPDVAAIGTNFQVYYRGKLKPVGGTSASTPTFGSMLSMINSERIAQGLPTLGYALPFLYEAWTTNSNAYFDITQSETQSTGCCKYSFDTAPGWDPYTGLGTPNYAVLSQLALSSSMFNFPEPASQK